MLDCPMLSLEIVPVAHNGRDRTEYMSGCQPRFFTILSAVKITALLAITGPISLL